MFLRKQQAARSGQWRRPQRRAFRPGLESLEDRCVPSTLTVTNTDDNVNEAGTLRFAVAHAASGDTILLTGAVKDGITLTQGDLVLSQNVMIEAAGNHQVAISGGQHSRIFEINAGVTVSLDNLELTLGNGTANNPADTSNLDGNGGAILNFGTLFIDNSLLDVNTADDGGGAILNDQGTLAVKDTTIANNAAPGVFGGGFGGGIWNFLGTVNVRDCVFSANSAAILGGGILNEGVLTVDLSTFSNNIGVSEGGGIDNFATMTVTNSEFDRNQAEFGAGIFTQGGTVTVTGSTFVNNDAANGGAIFNFLNGNVSVGTSSFSGNSPNNITGGFNDLGGNTGLP
jgi:hypothetical protein